jgi:Bacterial Ig domain
VFRFLDQDNPIVYDDFVEVNEDTDLVIALLGTDVDGDPITFFISEPPRYGTLRQTDNGITATAVSIGAMDQVTAPADQFVVYQPNPHYFGPDWFTISASSTSQLGPTLFSLADANVTISVLAVNDGRSGSVCAHSVLCLRLLLAVQPSNCRTVLSLSHILFVGMRCVCVCVFFFPKHL